MYVIIKDNIVTDIEKRNIPLSEIVHKDLHHLYHEVDNDTVKIGSIYDPDTNIFSEPENSEPEKTIDFNKPEITLTQLSQLISDLEANLIIAGVI